MIAKVSIAMILLFSTVSVFAENPADTISEFYATDISKGQVSFMWLGEGKGTWAGAASAGVLVKTSDHTIIIDPSNILEADAIDGLESLDLILLTHEHSDHFDPDSTAEIQEKTNAKVVASAGVYQLLEDKIAEDKLIEMLPDSVETIDGITVNAIPAEHPSDRPVMYLIKMDDVVVFHGSDSGFVDELNDIDSDVHIAFVPAGGASPTASPDDANSMVRALKPYVTVPVHGIFEEMKALEDVAGEETVVVIPSAFVVKVPSQIVPEFPFAAFVYVFAIIIAFVTMIKAKLLPFLTDR